MTNPVKDYYPTIINLIEEYESIEAQFNTRSLFVVNFPKVLLLSAMCEFEQKIKRSLAGFCSLSPDLLESEYPEIHKLLNNRQPTSDLIYQGFEANVRSGRMSAERFYDRFNGSIFKDRIRDVLTNHAATSVEYYSESAEKLFNLIEGGDDSFEYKYSLCQYRKERFDSLTFETAEAAFLDMKLNRNALAHDYLNGSNNTFEDVRNLFYDAASFIISAEISIDNLVLELNDGTG